MHSIWLLPVALVVLNVALMAKFRVRLVHAVAAFRLSRRIRAYRNAGLL